MAGGNHRADLVAGFFTLPGLCCSSPAPSCRSLLSWGAHPAFWPSHKLGHTTELAACSIPCKGPRRNSCPFRRANQPIPAALRPKGFHWESQAARLGNNVSAINLIYLLLSQTTCFFYCIYFKHSFKLCIIFQSF